MYFCPDWIPAQNEEPCSEFYYNVAASEYINREGQYIDRGDLDYDGSDTLCSTHEERPEDLSRDGFHERAAEYCAQEGLVWCRSCFIPELPHRACAAATTPEPEIPSRPRSHEI